jgi:preprotein translocase subunit SecF
MELFRIKNTIDFMSKRKTLMVISIVLIAISLGSLLINGLKLGIDFAGGTLVEVGYQETADLEVVRNQLVTGGFPESVVQHFGTSKDVLIRLAASEKNNADLSTKVMNALRAGGQEVELRRIEFVGPQAGRDLVENGGLAVLAALFGILIYVYFRFEIRFALGAILATVHDVVLTLGFFSLFQIEFDLTVLAAVLAVIGYSLNDTIVVYDRVREHFRKMRKGSTEEIINSAVTQTLSRTIMTSGTTLLTVLALFILGGQIIHGFSQALLVGIIVGTYSSIYVASALVLVLGISKADLMPVQKEGADLDSIP